MSLLPRLIASASKRSATTVDQFTSSSRAPIKKVLVTGVNKGGLQFAVSCDTHPHLPSLLCPSLPYLTAPQARRPSSLAGKMAPSRFTFSADFLRDPESLPQLPPRFPRGQWLDYTHFGIPPYGPYQHVYAVAWAGRQASRTWSRCLNLETPYPVGLFTRDPQPEPADIVDRTCFKLAVFDKAFET